MPEINPTLSPDFSKPQLFLADVNHLDQRIDNYLLSILKGVPKSRIYKLLRKGEVRVNKKRIKPTYRLAQGDIVRLPPVRVSQVDKPEDIQQSRLKLIEDNIIYEDKALIVINKPSGIAVHGGSGISYGVIEIMRQLKKLTYLELVHRLDRETSGCLMIAKKRSMLKHLHGLFQTNKITKKYWALVDGQWDKSAKSVKVPLQKNHLSSGERIVKVDVDGKPSKTQFRVIQSTKDASLIEAHPLTGRTHQIRVHATYAGHAIAGDEKYAEQAVIKKFKKVGLKRLFLHAHLLSFALPDSDERITIEAPLNKNLEPVVRKLFGDISEQIRFK